MVNIFKVLCGLPRCAEIKSQITPNSLFCSCNFVLKCLRACCRRNVVGHIQNLRESPSYSRLCTGEEIFFLGTPWFSQMDMDVNQTRESNQVAFHFSNFSKKTSCSDIIK